LDFGDTSKISNKTLNSKNIKDNNLSLKRKQSLKNIRFSISNKLKDFLNYQGKYKINSVKNNKDLNLTNPIIKGYRPNILENKFINKSSFNINSFPRPKLLEEIDIFLNQSKKNNEEKVLEYDEGSLIIQQSENKIEKNSLLNENFKDNEENIFNDYSFNRKKLKINEFVKKMNLKVKSTVNKELELLDHTMDEITNNKIIDDYNKNNLENKLDNYSSEPNHFSNIPFLSEKIDKNQIVHGNRNKNYGNIIYYNNLDKEK